MSMQDQLTRAERIRLESLAQSIQSFLGINCPDGDILARARVFERFLHAADNENSVEMNPPDHSAEHLAEHSTSRSAKPGGITLVTKEFVEGTVVAGVDPRSDSSHADHESWRTE